MITVNLSVEEYNRLYVCCDDCEETCFFCKRLDNDIVLIEPESDIPIVHIKANSPEGIVFSHYTNCMLGCFIKENGDISFRNVCDGAYYGCENYSYRAGCKLGISDYLNKFTPKIEDVSFINPIPNRNSEIIDSLRYWSRRIASMDEDFKLNPDEDIKNICMTAKLLETQLKELYDRWRYNS